MLRGALSCLHFCTQRSGLGQKNKSAGAFFVQHTVIGQNSADGPVQYVDMIVHFLIPMVKLLSTTSSHFFIYFLFCYFHKIGSKIVNQIIKLFSL